MLGVVMVTGVAFTAVLEHNLNSVNPGEWALLLTWYLKNLCLPMQAWWDWQSPMHYP